MKHECQAIIVKRGKKLMQCGKRAGYVIERKYHARETYRCRRHAADMMLDYVVHPNYASLGIKARKVDE